MKNKIDTNKILGYFVNIYIFFVFYNRVFELIDFTSLYSYAILTIPGLVIFIYLFLNKKLNAFDLSLTLVILFGTIINVISNFDLSLFRTILLLIGNLSIAKWIFINKKNDKTIVLILTPIILYYLFLVFSGSNVKLVNDITSKNHIWINTILCIGLMIFVFSRSFKSHKYFDHLLLILTVSSFLISVWTQSRASIIAAILFLLLNIIYLYFYKKRRIMVLFFVLIPIIITFLFNLINLNDIFGVFYRKDFFSDVRYEIFEIYIQKIDFLSIFSGVNLDSIFPVIDLYNIHNSYIEIHSEFGFIGIYIFLIYLFSLFKLFRKNFIYFSILLAILIRAWSDTFLFYYFDFIIFILIFTGLDRRKGNDYDKKTI